MSDVTAGDILSACRVLRSVLKSKEHRCTVCKVFEEIFEENIDDYDVRVVVLNARNIALLLLGCLKCDKCKG